MSNTLSLDVIKEHVDQASTLSELSWAANLFADPRLALDLVTSNTITAMIDARLQKLSSGGAPPTPTSYRAEGVFTDVPGY